MPFSTDPRRSKSWLDVWRQRLQRVTLLLNIQRKRGDTASSDEVVGRFAGDSHLKSGELAVDKNLLLTAILADGINLGLTKMA
jgi:hypothetical protein